MGLVWSADYDELPLEPVQRWLKLRDLVERRLIEATDYQNGPSEEDLIEYCSILINAAQSLDLGNFEDVSVGQIRQNYPFLRSQIIGLATRLSVGGNAAREQYSVSLSPRNKVLIINEIEKLRVLVDGCDLTTSQKKRLNSKLNDLHKIVLNDRVDYAKLMAIIAYFSAGVVNSTTFLADAPHAIATISSIVGTAKEEEEQTTRLLEKNKGLLQLPDLRKGEDADDNIPF